MRTWICAGAVALAGACSGGAKAAAPPENGGGSDRGGLTLSSAAVPGGHAAIVTNGGSAAVRLRRELIVEHDDGGTWSAVDASGLYLRDHCDDAGGGLFEPPACVEIAAGATLETEPWTDEIGDSQCACEECGPVPGGSYRFRVTPCDAGDGAASAPFNVAAPAR
jgi:hypothetical protein